VSIYDEEVRQIGAKLIDKLGYTGICEVEFLWNSTKNEYQLIEMNARTWLWVGLAKRCGVDFANLTYQFVNNQEIRFPKSYDKKIFWYNPITHFSMIFFLVIKGKYRFLSIFHIPLFSTKENALFSWRDMKPGFVYFLKIFTFLNNR
jgi:predicted ATP-grasp superfamily ATP-dependent carboligase